MLSAYYMYGFPVSYARRSKTKSKAEQMKIFEVILGLTQMEHYYDVEDVDALRGALNEILKNDPSKLEDALKGAFDTFDPNTVHKGRRFSKHYGAG